MGQRRPRQRGSASGAQERVLSSRVRDVLAVAAAVRAGSVVSTWLWYSRT